jgi:hypothetical protein
VREKRELQCEREEECCKSSEDMGSASQDKAASSQSRQATWVKRRKIKLNMRICKNKKQEQPSQLGGKSTADTRGHRKAHRSQAGVTKRGEQLS